MTLRWIVYVAPNKPLERAQKHKVSKIRQINNFETVRDMMSVSINH